MDGRVSQNEIISGKNRKLFAFAKWDINETLANKFDVQSRFPRLDYAALMHRRVEKRLSIVLFGDISAGIMGAPIRTYNKFCVGR